jgi:hypothetical protein
MYHRLPYLSRGVFPFKSLALYIRPRDTKQYNRSIKSTKQWLKIMKSSTLDFPKIKKKMFMYTTIIVHGK